MDVIRREKDCAVSDNEDNKNHNRENIKYRTSFDHVHGGYTTSSEDQCVGRRCYGQNEGKRAGNCSGEHYVQRVDLDLHCHAE